jgi:8-oxo-dGTP pyrophosphatase MutT (NUDIX family)
VSFQNLFQGGEKPSGAPPRDAATVILLRPSGSIAGSYTVFLVKRVQGVQFMGGAHVFPGGRVNEGESIEAAAVREVREECGVELDAASLRPWARWVTPEAEKKRFDARFFVARVPGDQIAKADEAEVTEGDWLAPADALTAVDDGKIFMAPPTIWNLMELAALPTIENVLLEAERRKERGIQPIMPTLSLEGGAVELRIPGGRFTLEDGRFRAFRT